MANRTAADAGTTPDQDLGNTSPQSDSATIDRLLDESGVVDVPEGGTPTPAAAPAAPAKPAASAPAGSEPAAEPGKPITPGTKVVPQRTGKLTTVKTTAGEPAKTEPKVIGIKSPAGTPPIASSRSATAPDGKPATPPAPAAAPKAAAPAAVTPPAPTVTPDKELDAIEEPKGMSPANSANWKKLRDTAARYKAQYAEAVTAAATLEKAAGKLTPDVEARIKEADTIIKTFAIQKDPEFVAKFDAPIETNTKEIYELLESRGLSKSVLDALKADGGIGSKSLKWWDEYDAVDAAGKPVKQDGFLRLLRNSADADDNAAAVVIEEKLKQNAHLAYNKHQEVQKAAAGQSDYHKNREEAEKKRVEHEGAVMRKRVEEIQASIPWARLQEIPADASPEEKARIEKENEFYKQSENRFDHALNSRDPNVRVETALAACLSFRLADELQESQAQLAAAREEIAAMKAAGQTHRAGAAAPLPGAQPAPSRLSMSNADAIEAGLQEAEGA